MHAAAPVVVGGRQLQRLWPARIHSQPALWALSLQLSPLGVGRCLVPAAILPQTHKCHLPPAIVRLCSVTHTNAPLCPRVIPGAPSSATSPQPGFWWGWPAGAWTAGTLSTPASSPGSTTSPTGSTRPRGSHPPLIPHLLLSLQSSLCRPPAPRGVAQPSYLPRPGSCYCLRSGTHGRPCGDPPSPSVQLSASDPVCLLEPSTPPLPQPHWLSGFLRDFPVHQLPPPKPSLKKQTETNKGLIPLLSGDPIPPPVPQRSPLPRGQASGSRCKERGPVRETVLGGSQGCQLGGEQTPPLPQGALASTWAFRGSVSGSSGCLTNTRDPLEQKEFITSQPWRWGVGGPGVGGPVSPEASLRAGRPGLLRLSRLPRCPHMVVPLCVFVSLSPYKDTSHMGLGPP